MAQSRETKKIRAWARGGWYAFVLAALCLALSVLVAFPRRYESTIEKACRIYGVEPALVYAVARCESGFRSSARSRAGAVGVMQLMPNTARFIAAKSGQTAEDLADAETSIMLGTAYLRYLLDRFSLRDAVAAYNAGEGNVRRWRAEGRTEYPYPETAAYVRRVLHAKRIYAILL